MPINAIDYPTAVDDNVKKYVYLYRIQELLRIQHNDMGQKYKLNQITKNQWLQFLKTWEEKQHLVESEIIYYRSIAKENNTNDPANLDDIFIN